jgi:hypothetical protein
MESNPVLRATALAALIAELLHRAAATTPRGQTRHEMRYAEALAQTLRDQLDSMVRLQSDAA